MSEGLLGGECPSGSSGEVEHPRFLSNYVISLSKCVSEGVLGGGCHVIGKDVYVYGMSSQQPTG